MTHRTVFLTISLILASTARLGAVQGEKGEQNWPSFRGRNANGIAEGYETPTVWSAQEPKNIQWKTRIPGLAHSSPVIWDSSLFVTSAISLKKESNLRVGLPEILGRLESVQDDTVHAWRVYRLDKNTGEILWERTAHEGAPRVKRHPKATQANPTPATDGKRVVVFFGSEGLYCYDLSGKLLWKKDLGVLDAAFFQEPDRGWGFASSPIIHGNVVFVQCDIIEGSFLAAFDLEDGRELWRTPRDDVPTWSTPTVHQRGDRTLLLVNGWKHIGGYDATTGKEIWRLRGGGDIPVPTPVVAHDLAFFTNAHGSMAPIYAIRLDAQGDISLEGGSRSNDYVAWSVDRGGAYMQTPLIYGEYLYNCRDNGVLSCYRAETGERVYRKRLGSGGMGFSASPVAANGKIYFTSEFGDVFVVRAGPEFELLATNSLDEIAMATPAISEGKLYFRTRSHVLAVSEK